jgi:hypothetical protein
VLVHRACCRRSQLIGKNEWLIENLN